MFYLKAFGQCRRPSLKIPPLKAPIKDLRLGNIVIHDNDDGNDGDYGDDDDDDDDDGHDDDYDEDDDADDDYDDDG